MRGPRPKETASSRIAKTSGDYTVIAGQCKFERAANTPSVMCRGVLRGRLGYAFRLDLHTGHLLDESLIPEVFRAWNQLFEPALRNLRRESGRLFFPDHLLKHN
jgi:hypothetical protein